MEQELIKLRDMFVHEAKSLDKLLKRLNQSMLPPVDFAGLFKLVYKASGEGSVHLEGKLEISKSSESDSLIEYCVSNIENRKTRAYFKTNKGSQWIFTRDFMNFGLGVDGCDLKIPVLYLAIPIADCEEEARIYYE